MGISPWAHAHAAATAADVSLRPLTSIEDADRVLEVMVATWGNHQLLPREMIVALGESGNVPYGAVDTGGRLVGYVLGWAGMDQDGLHVHSHMLAALPDRRHRGVGFALKLAQRAQALEQGIRVMRWTFDPMVARNAWLNLGKLGAVADRFRRDFYGRMSDTVNEGERSDRLVVRWDLEAAPGPRAAPAAVATVTVPPEYAELRRRDPGAARAARDETAAALESLFAEGWVAVAFDRTRSAYLLAAADAL
ncbi:MAG: GNAT family N-acetyltransferase [Actinomycetota bacterium]